jgi:soluble lytic murein transglycosylase-like protein
MTVVLVVSTALVTTAAWHSGSPSASAVVCRGARAVSATTGGTGVSARAASTGDGAVPVASGVVPPALAAQPARLRLLPVFDRWASVCALPAALVEATCWWESGWQQDVVSVTGAVGVCQIEPSTVETVRELLDDSALDPRSTSDNIEMSAAYLRWLLDEDGGRQDLALAGYYQGPTSVKEHGILAGSRPYVTGITALLHDYTWS